MGKINELPNSTSRLLTSSQIITSVYCVVKELIENALDSSAKNVEVKLEDYGLEKIEVKDNGCGIDKQDIQFVAKPHFTSKITSYSDLDKVETYGFRGEALGAVCAVADLVITTKLAEENVGCVVNFGHDGQVISTKPCPCAQGTTVSVLNLFKNIPVRKQYYRTEKNKKDDLRKVEDLLISYGCIQNDVRFALYHNKNLIWQKPALSSTRNALIHIFGNAVMEYLDFAEHADEQTHRKIEAYLPKLGAPLTCGLTSSSRCITAINKRPVRIKAIEKLIKIFYNKAILNSGKARYPICFIAFTASLGEVDVNVEPNKTIVMLHHSEEILQQFSDLLNNFYKTPDVGDNILPPEKSSTAQEPKSNASDFVNSLKVKCDVKLQQSKLTTVNGFSSSLEKESSKNYDLHITSKELIKIDEPLTKSDVIEIGALKEPSKKKLKTNSQSSKKDIENHINTLKSFFEVESQANGEKLSNVSSNFSDSIPTVTVQRICTNSNDKNFPEATNTIDEGKMTTFEVSTNICSNKSLFDSDSVNNRKRHLSNSSIPTFDLKDDYIKKPVLDVEIQNGDAWSRGLCPSGGLFQPVAILHPKTTTAVESNLKSLDDNISNKKEFPVKIPESCAKRPDKDDSDKKEFPAERNVLLERKLTSFDIFCRNYRLEVAAQNPKFNNQQIAQVLSEKWNRLSTEEKAVYKNMLDKDYKKDIKKKERLGKTISQNLTQSKKESGSPSKSEKTKLKPKRTSKAVSCSMEKIKIFNSNKKGMKLPCENLNIINYLSPGIWLCAQKEKLYLLNTFRLQETIVYHRLLETFHFETEPLETPQIISTSNIGEDALAVLMQMVNSGINVNDKISDERVLANGFDIKFSQGEQKEVSFELCGITSCIAFYGIIDLKELLLIIKEKGFSTSLPLCRPSKILLYLQSEANRMSRQNPACQRLQEVEDLLNQKKHLPDNCNSCIHHKAFFNEIWKLDSSS